MSEHKPTPKEASDALDRLSGLSPEAIGSIEEQCRAKEQGSVRRERAFVALLAASKALVEAKEACEASAGHPGSGDDPRRSSALLGKRYEELRAAIDVAEGK